MRLKLPAMSNEYFTSTLCDAFDLQRLRYLYNRVNRIYQVNLSNLYPDQARRFNTVGAGISEPVGETAPQQDSGKDNQKTFAGIRSLSDTAQKFQKQIRYIAASIHSGAPDDFPLLRERVTKACEYFRKELRPLASFAAPLTLIEIDDKEIKKAFKAAAEEFLSELRFRLTLYETILSEGFSTKEYHKLKADNELSEARSLKALARSFSEAAGGSLRQAQRPDADGEPVEPPIAKQTQKPADRQSQEESDTYTGSTHPELVQALIDWRREKYQKDNVPAYIILHQKTLLAIADLAPTTREELLTVKGFGKSKCDKYGDEILDVIRQGLKSK